MAAVPAPPEADTPVQSLPPEEAVPTPAQEPGVEETPPASGAPEKPDEAEVDPVALLKELVADNPELAEALGVKPEEPALDEQKFAWDLERSEQERKDLLTGATAYEQAQVSEAYGGVVDYLWRLNAGIEEAAQKVLAGDTIAAQEAAAKLVNFDAEGVGKQLWPMIQRAQLARAYAVSAYTQAQFREAVETHPVYRSMDKDARQAFREALGKFDWKAAAVAALDAGLKAAPEAISKKAQVEADKKAALLEKAAKLQEAIGSNGRRRSLTGGQGGSIGYATLAEAEELYVDGKLTHEQYREARERFMVKGQ